MTRLHLVLSIAWVVLLGAGCGEEEVVEETLAPSVSAARVQSVDLEEEIRASGDLEAKLHTMIAAEIEGRITGISVDEGAFVEAGSTVIEIDPERRELELAADRAHLSEAWAGFRKEKSQAARIRKLRTENISSEQALEEAETALSLARSKYAARRADMGVAERALADASVRAPFSGHVAKRAVQLGEFVQKGAPLFELVALDPLEVVFRLTELDTERVRVGQVVDIEVGAFENRRFHGVVTFISPTVDPETRTLRMKAEIKNDEGTLRPGLFAKLSLGVNRREGVLMVPEEALIQRANGAILYRIGDDDRVERIVVETGAIRDGRVEVKGAVAVGDRIVRGGHGGLVDGAQVVVRESAQGALAAKKEVADGA